MPYIRAALRRAAFTTAVIAAAGAAAAPAARADTERTVISLPADNVQFLPFYLGLDTGLFARHGLEVKFVYLAGVGTTNGVISGAVDFGVSNGASLTRAAARGQPLLAIAIMGDRPTWSILVRKSIAEAAHFDPAAPLAERARVLAGHSFAVDTMQSVAHAYLRVVAKTAGLDPEAIAVTPLVATEAIAAFQRKAIDGVVTAAPWREILEADGGTVAVAQSLEGDPAWLTPFAGGLVITRAPFCAEHRSICMKLGHALVEAVQIVHAHPPEALAVLQQHFSKIDPAILARAFAMVRQGIAETPVVTEASVANSDRLNLEAGFITADQQLKSYGALFTDEFVR